MLRRAFVGIIILVLLSVPTLGFAYLLPRLFSGLTLALHVGLSCLLALNIYFNFVAAIIRHPGRLTCMLGIVLNPLLSRQRTCRRRSWCSCCRASGMPAASGWGSCGPGRL